MKEELIKYLYNFMIENNWDYDKVPDQTRALFTTICFVGNIDADTKEAHDILTKLYNQSCLDELVEYEEFEQYMYELII